MMGRYEEKKVSYNNRCSLGHCCACGSKFVWSKQLYARLLAQLSEGRTNDSRALEDVSLEFGLDGLGVSASLRERHLPADAFWL